MRITLICVSKQRDEFTPLIQDYTERLNRAIKTELLYVAPSGKPEKEARKYESNEIRQKLKPNAIVWLLDERGEQVSSPVLAQKLNVAQYQGVQELALIIGGAYGIDDSLRQKAHFVWSLSAMVMPHRLAQLVVVEQLYRATEINRGSGYHHV